MNTHVCHGGHGCNGPDCACPCHFGAGAPKRRTSSRRRRYLVGNVPAKSFDDACGRAVALAAKHHESICIVTEVGGKVVERIDVTAALSIDPVE